MEPHRILPSEHSSTGKIGIMDRDILPTSEIPSQGGADYMWQINWQAELGDLRGCGFHHADDALAAVQFDGDPLTDRKVKEKFRCGDVEDHFSAKIGGQPSLFFRQVEL